MRFETRFDRWQAILLFVLGAILFSLPVVLYSTLAAQGAPIWPLLPGPILFAAVLTVLLPQYYELRDDGLFIRRGWRRMLLPYPSLRELAVWNSPLSAPVFSTHRLVVSTLPGGQFVIAVAQQERFLAEIARRAPQLEPTSSGLGTPGASPVWLG